MIVCIKVTVDGADEIIKLLDEASSFRLYKNPHFPEEMGG